MMPTILDSRIEVYVVLFCSFTEEEYICICGSYQKAIEQCRLHIKERGFNNFAEYSFRENSQSVKFKKVPGIYFILKETVL